ncbi:N-acetylglucosamine-6-phosphate deacetylase [Pseudoalteromonas lipolytica]|jgi:N-acetylglucosamine-6-phosphate deacetylase|uniref:N-acetylgalactosamine-6-phosphate deacetylase n=1 Tax=Pseudoalteromonas lipolytica TaxID=570156 RepID=A0AAD0RZY3_9GAMM|nr:MULTISPECIES: N-acetylglucosamine-6-phosphate deacetylase [Pseudoalteromonas]AXV64964.1 N-acetylglucosamine-6-phosphate deacetylase [Pseudoalteromonas donghaensis]EWH06693.1 N-acetylglucosamine 6-phosphate deacetylase [Pseudoalteromonas lipolytica SCSIO 04301]MBE0351226.1 N-acetylglucosamine-6-phosphate deacetylase [Pseudoalteromonas lipolytica LMEB 39]QLJ09466.1 N-acetylglucosamine-6-phosphate deacetylase [Pseudoalteromonas sp. JSTW]QMW15673.1 N-acetylglucosamine-6-phosphate deacetylase [P
MATYHATSLFTGDEFLENVFFSVANGVMTFVDAVDNAIELDGLVAPGFIDVQVNGGGGAFFNAEQTTECLDRIAKAHGQFGTTALMPTLITDKVEVMAMAADATAKALAEGVPGVLGIHFEGPHLSFPKKGTHSEQFIRPITEQEFAIYARQDLGIKMVTLAPESVSTDDIARLIECGVKVSIGHTNADFATTNAALAAGADGFTHLFNAMSAFTSREPGVVGAALWDDNSWCGLIVDGHHVHPSSAKLAIRTKQRGKIMLVTDAMPPVGTNDMEFDFFDGRKVIRTGDRLNSTTGELAGSVLDMASAVRNTVNTLDVSLAETLRMASLYPAQYLGLKKKGRLLEGYDADFVVLDEHQCVTATFIAGKAL